MNHICLTRLVVLKRPGFQSQKYGMSAFTRIDVARGGKKGHGPQNFLENIVILCFDRRFSKQNSVIRPKSNLLAPPNFSLPKFLGWLRPCLHVNNRRPAKTRLPVLTSLYRPVYMSESHSRVADASVNICCCMELENMYTDVQTVVCLRGGERGTCLGPSLLGGTPLRSYARKFYLFLRKNLGYYSLR